MNCRDCDAVTDEHPLAGVSVLDPDVGPEPRWVMTACEALCPAHAWRSDSFATHRVGPWRIALCHRDKPPASGCQPAVLQGYTWHAADSMWKLPANSPHQGACWGCDWRGQNRDTENEATEEAHDHAFPGWRQLPALEAPPGIGNPGYNRKKWQRAVESAMHIFPPGWRERAGPTISWREPFAGRHVPGRGLFGGYDMARIRPTAQTRPRAEPIPPPAHAVQISLFESCLEAST